MEYLVLALLAAQPLITLAMLRWLVRREVKRLINGPEGRVAVREYTEDLIQYVLPRSLRIHSDPRLK